MIIVLARGAVEVLVDDVLAGAIINKVLAHTGQDGVAAPDLKRFATMNADKLRPAKIVAGDIAEHGQYIFGRYSHGFHPCGPRITIEVVLDRHVGYEFEINHLNQFRMAHIWEQEPKEAHANKRNKLSDFHYIVYTPFILFPPWGIPLGGKSAFAVNDKICDAISCRGRSSR